MKPTIPTANVSAKQTDKTGQFKSSKKSASYVPDLQQSFKQSAQIYQLFTLLCPSIKSASTNSLLSFLPNADQSNTSEELNFLVLEQTPHTSLIQLFCQGIELVWMQPLVLDVRLYHDVQMAEVFRCQGQSIQQGVYSYPNPKMLAPDEKNQQNEFLLGWISQLYAAISSPLMQSESIFSKF
ncbi:MAG: DUF1249 domain-containing protein [Pseudomonadota bacterium]